MSQNADQTAHSEKLRELQGRDRRNTALMNALIDAAPDGMLVLDQAGLPLLFNKTYLSIWNLTDDQVNGQLAGGLFDVSPDLIENGEAFAVDLLRDLGKGHRYSWREIVLCSGTVIEEITRPFEDENGDPAGRMWFFRDVTTRVAFEKQLMLTAELFSGSPKPMAILSDDFHIIQANAALIEHFGYSEIDLVGRQLDFLAKDDEARRTYAELLAGLRNDERWDGSIKLTTLTGETETHHLSIAPARGETGIRSDYAVVFSDVSQNEAELETLRQAAHHDPLTGLPNRAMMEQVVAAQIGIVQRQGGWVALAVIDLDGFKEINDTHGHQIGDELLVHVSRNLERVVRPSDRIFRLGGDEFVVAAVCSADMASLNSLARKLVQITAVPMKHGLQKLKVSASVGLAYFPVHGDGLNALMKAADDAMYKSKKAGKGRAVIAGFAGR